MSGQDTEKISIKKITVCLTFETQMSNLGRPFRLSGTRKNLQKPTKWIDGVEKWHWIHTFKYLDEKGGFFDIELDYNKKFIQLIKL